jgi:5-methylcytosine-specific restriction endonuclease McrA
MNRWNIPPALEKEVRQRDKSCVYCRIKFRAGKAARKFVATWEHIINDARIVTRENIALCCFSCNSSKGTKRLADWFKSEYCKSRGIGPGTVAGVIKRALAA